MQVFRQCCHSKTQAILQSHGGYKRCVIVSGTSPSYALKIVLCCLATKDFIGKHLVTRRCQWGRPVVRDGNRVQDSCTSLNYWGTLDHASLCISCTPIKNVTTTTCTLNLQESPSKYKLVMHASYNTQPCLI